MIRFEALTLARAGEPLFSGASVSIHAGERIALIGANGSGKSSLLAALRGELAPDAGDIVLPDWRIAWLAQATPQASVSALDYVQAADGALAAARTEVDAADASGDGVRIAAAWAHWHDAGGHDAKARAAELLSGLGFDDAAMQRAVDDLSGGWKMRLNLACALMAPADLLLLDEPTNHLDLDAVLWLERTLVRLPVTQIIVSHDRDFLDRVATASLAIDEGRLVRYTGGYTASELLRAEHAAQREREREANQSRIDHLSAFVERFRAKATKARQAQSRLKALERIERIAPLRARSGLSFQFTDPPPGPDPLIRAQALDCGHGDRTIVHVPELTVRRGARIGILGRNGAGKSTLVRTLTGTLPPLGGEIVRAPTMKVGYLAQEQVESLRPQDSALEHLRRIAPQERDQVLRSFLGTFRFGGDDAMRPVGPMSGGEKARLTLALLAWTQPGFLVLDEPTNHLDGDSRDALAEALADFDGALLLVSHDRYLLRAAVDEFVLIDDGVLRPFDGDLDDYAQWLAGAAGRGMPGGVRAGAGSRAGAADGAGANDSDGAAARAGTGAGAAAPDRAGNGTDARTQAGPGAAAGNAAQRRDRARLRTELNARLRPMRQRLARIDDLLERHRQRAGVLDAEMARPGAFDDPQAAAGRARERAEIDRDVAALEEEWLELGAAIESATAAVD